MSELNKIIGETLCGYLNYSKTTGKNELCITGIRIDSDKYNLIKIENFLSDYELNFLFNLTLKNIDRIREKTDLINARLLEFVLKVPDKQINDELLITNIQDISNKSTKFPELSKKIKKTTISLDKHKRVLDPIQKEWLQSPIKKIFDKFDVYLGDKESKSRTIIAQEGIIQKYLAYLNYVYSCDKKQICGVCYPDSFLSNDIVFKDKEKNFYFRAKHYFKAISYIYAAINCILNSDGISPLKKGDKILYDNKIRRYSGVKDNSIILSSDEDSLTTEDTLYILPERRLSFTEKIIGLEKSKIPLINSCSSFFLIENKDDFDLINDIFLIEKGTKDEYHFSDVFSFQYFTDNGISPQYGLKAAEHYDLVFSLNYFTLHDLINDYAKKGIKTLSLTVDGYDSNSINLFKEESELSVNKIISMINFSRIRKLDEIKKYFTSTFLPLGKMCDYIKESANNSPANILFSWELEDIKNKKLTLEFFDTALEYEEYQKFTSDVNFIKYDKNLENGERFAILAFSIRKKICSSISYDDEMIQALIQDLNNNNLYALPERLKEKKESVLQFLRNLSKVSYDTKLKKITTILDQLNKNGAEIFENTKIKQSVLFVTADSADNTMNSLLNYRKTHNLQYENLRIDYCRPTLSWHKCKHENADCVKFDEKHSYYDNMIYLFSRTADFDFYELNNSTNKIVLACDFDKTNILRIENTAIENLQFWCKKSPFKISFNKEIHELPLENSPEPEIIKGLIPKDVDTADSDNMATVSVKAIAKFTSGESILFTEKYKGTVICLNSDNKFIIEKILYSELEEDDEVILCPDSSLSIEDNLILHIFKERRDLLNNEEMEAVQFILGWKNKLKNEWFDCCSYKWWKKIGVCKQTMENWAFGNTILPESDSSIKELASLLKFSEFNNLKAVRNYGRKYRKLRVTMEEASNEAILAKKNNQVINDAIVNFAVESNITKIYTINEIYNIELNNIPYNKVNRPIK